VLVLAQKIIFVSKSYGLSLTKSYQSSEDFIANLFKRSAANLPAAAHKTSFLLLIT
jgi:hypothetical protein